MYRHVQLQVRVAEEQPGVLCTILCQVPVDYPCSGIGGLQQPIWSFINLDDAQTRRKLLQTRATNHCYCDATAPELAVGLIKPAVWACCRARLGVLSDQAHFALVGKVGPVQAAVALERPCPEWCLELDPGGSDRYGLACRFDYRLVDSFS